MRLHARGSVAPAGISETDWLATPAAVRSFILVQQAELQAHQQECELLRSQLTALASELAQLGRVPVRGEKPEARMP